MSRLPAYTPKVVPVTNSRKLLKDMFYCTRVAIARLGLL